MARKIPEGYGGITPYLIVRNASKAIDFYKRAFGATEVMRLTGPGGTIGHAELRMGNSHVMLADEMPDMGHLGPESLKGTPVSFLLYFDDVDAQFDRALVAGATVKRPVENQFYGDRSGVLTDPFGHVWSLATHVEDVSPEEMDRRYRELLAKQ